MTARRYRSHTRCEFSKTSTALLVQRRLLFLTLGLAAVLNLGAATEPTALPNDTHFLAADAVDPRALIPPPPAPDSLIQHAEIEVLLNLQAARTPAQVTRARQIQAEDVFVFGSDVLGPWFNAANLPKAAAFFAQVSRDFVPLNHATKKLFNRRRPPYQDERIKPCVEFSDTGSYPSGHATQSAMWAVLFTAIYPDHADHFSSRAAETRWARLVGGAHHPTDVEAGRVIGEEVARQLLKIPSVQAAIRELQAEAAPFLLQKAA